MTTVQVFTAQEALAAATADANNVVVIEKKKDDKAYKGTRFLNAFVNIGSHTKKEPWFNIENIPLTAGVADPDNKKDPRNEYEGTRLQLETKLSLTGDFGQYLKLVDPVYQAKITAMAAAGTINITDRKLHGLMQTHLSKNNAKNPGAEIADPVIRFKIDFDPYPATYPHKFLRGLPRTTFFDYDTKYTDEKGVEQFKPAMIVNDDGSEEPVTTKNLHKFIVEGSTIKRARVMMPSVPISSSWVSWPIVLGKTVIERGSGGGFSDEDSSTPAMSSVKSALEAKVPVTSSAMQSPTTQPESTQSTSDAVPPVAKPVNADDINNLLADI